MATEQGGSGQAAQRLGLVQGQTVQELGYDADVEDSLRTAVEAIVGSPMVDEDHDDVIDVVLMWWRDEDGDLVDALVDAIAPLADHGVISQTTP